MAHSVSVKLFMQIVFLIRLLINCRIHCKNCWECYQLSIAQTLLCLKEWSKIAHSFLGAVCQIRLEVTEGWGAELLILTLVKPLHRERTQSLSYQHHCWTKLLGLNLCTLSPAIHLLIEVLQKNGVSIEDVCMKGPCIYGLYCWHQYIFDKKCIRKDLAALLWYTSCSKLQLYSASALQCTASQDWKEVLNTWSVQVGGNPEIKVILPSCYTILLCKL